MLRVGGSSRPASPLLVGLLELALAADLEIGRHAFEPWVRAAGDADIRWIVKENLNKKRLATLDPDWAGAYRALLAR